MDGWMDGCLLLRMDRLMGNNLLWEIRYYNVSSWLVGWMEEFDGWMAGWINDE